LAEFYSWSGNIGARETEKSINAADIKARKRGPLKDGGSEETNLEDTLKDIGFSDFEI
jgi:hypothetical protein